jgi:hypothetical protein
MLYWQTYISKGSHVMGCVKMGRGESEKFEGNYISSTAYCIYCDKCGSFDIGKSPLRIIIIGFLVIVISYISLALWGDLTVHSMIVCPTLLLLTLSTFGLLSKQNVCKKCGNYHITQGNPMNYSENDRSVLDVHYSNTQKIYSDDYY